MGMMQQANQNYQDPVQNLAETQNPRQPNEQSYPTNLQANKQKWKRNYDLLDDKDR